MTRPFSRDVSEARKESNDLWSAEVYPAGDVEDFLALICFYGVSMGGTEAPRGDKCAEPFIGLGEAG